MPIPSFKDTLQGNLGPDITIIASGDYFDIEENTGGLDITKMNQELASVATSDEIVFIQSDPPKEDLSFKLFLDSRKKSK